VHYARDISGNVLTQSQAASNGSPRYYFIHDGNSVLRLAVDENGRIAAILFFNPGGDLQGQSSDWVFVSTYRNAATGVQAGVGEMIAQAALGTYSPPARTFALTTGGCV